MGALGKSIPISGEGDREAAYRATWQIICEFVEAHLSIADRRVADGYTSCLDHDLSGDGDDDDAFTFMFTDGGGNCTRSKYAWTHWTEVAVAIAWDTIDACLHRYGFALRGERWTHARDGELVELRDSVWHIQSNCLHGDGDSIDYDDLDDAEAALVEAARTACACPLCTRPQAAPRLRAHAPAFEAAPIAPVRLPDSEVGLIAALGDRSLAVAAADRLAATSTVAVLLAIVRAEAPMPQLVTRVRRCARGVDAWDPLVAAYPKLAAGERGLALYALAEMPRDEVRTAWLVGHVRDALAHNDRTAEAAAEIAGSLGVDLSAELTAVLGRLGVDAELRAKVELGLAQLRR